MKQYRVRFEGKDHSKFAENALMRLNPDLLYYRECAELSNDENFLDMELRPGDNCTEIVFSSNSEPYLKDLFREASIISQQLVNDLPIGNSEDLTHVSLHLS